MRLIPRRKRTWLVVLLSVAIVGAAGMWWVVTAKSDFERRYDQIKGGLNASEARYVIESGLSSNPICSRDFTVQLMYDRFVWANDGERIVLTFESGIDGQLITQEFTPLPPIEKLRRQWRRTFRFEPPF